MVDQVVLVVGQQARGGGIAFKSVHHAGQMILDHVPGPADVFTQFPVPQSQQHLAVVRGEHPQLRVLQGPLMLRVG